MWTVWGEWNGRAGWGGDMGGTYCTLGKEVQANQKREIGRRKTPPRANWVDSWC